MGYIRHDAIVITSWDRNRLSAIHNKAQEIGLTCSDLVASPTNGYVSFLVAPDGSKEGWIESDRGEKQRSKFVNWLRETSNEYYPEWVHINYGGDNAERCAIEDYSGKSVE